MSYTAVIEISFSRESPKKAIKSVLRNEKYIEAVVFVDTKNYEGKFYYDNFSSDVDKIRNKGMAFVVRKKLTDYKFKTPYTIQIPPRCDIYENAFNLLKEDIKASKNETTHWAVRSRVVLPGGSLFYGFFMIHALMNLLWNIWDRGKTYSYTDVIVTSVVKNGEKIFKAPEVGLVKYIRNKENNSVIIPDNDESCVYTFKSTPVKALHEATKLNRKTTFSWVSKMPFVKLWMIFYLYYWLFTASVCIFLLTHVSYAFGGDPSTIWYVKLTGWRLYVPLSLWFSNYLLMLYATQKYYKINHLVTMSVFLPFYIICAPLVWIISKIIK